jgi:hypothetical protein
MVKIKISKEDLVSSYFQFDGTWFSHGHYVVGAIHIKITNQKDIQKLIEEKMPFDNKLCTENPQLSHTIINDLMKLPNPGKDEKLVSFVVTPFHIESSGILYRILWNKESDLVIFINDYYMPILTIGKIYYSIIGPRQVDDTYKQLTSGVYSMLDDYLVSLVMPAQLVNYQATWEIISREPILWM